MLKIELIIVFKMFFVEGVKFYVYLFVFVDCNTTFDRDRMPKKQVFGQIFSAIGAWCVEGVLWVWGGVCKA